MSTSKMSHRTALRLVAVRSVGGAVGFGGPTAIRVGGGLLLFLVFSHGFPNASVFLPDRVWNV